MLEEALEHLVRGIVDHPDEVSVTRPQRPARPHPRGAGAPRGPRQGDRPGGRTAKALRTVIGALGPGRGVRVDFLDVDER